MYTCVAFILGLCIGGIVSFFVTACIVSETRQQEESVYQAGYNAGYYDGLHQKGV